MRTETVLRKLRDLGFDEAEAAVLADHFLEAERRGKRGHGLARIDWLADERFEARGAGRLVVEEEGYQRWDGDGAIGYLMLAAICRAQINSPPKTARLVVAADCFPSGMLGYWTRQLAEAGLVAALTATSPPRLAHPEGGPRLAGTNPLSIAVPSTEGPPVVADVSMGEVTYGDVIAGRASEEDLVPFGGEKSYKAFALALGLQLFVDALAGEGHGAVLVVAQPYADPIPGLRRAAPGVRLPGDGPTKA